jgi:peptidoglycan L-alanyl-D-glutamate endopeptidase CwlK
MGAVLRRGSEGEEVARLQRRLRGQGFSPGLPDRRFGPATEAALLAFQRARGLLADGICGPETWAALEPGSAPPSRPDHAGALSVDLVAEIFPFTARGAIRLHLPPVVLALREFGLVEKPMVLAALATIRAESEGFLPIDEAISRFNTSPGGSTFDLYDHRRDLGNESPPDGRLYRGRGFVQLTGRDNYRRVGEVLGLGTRLLREPDLATEPVTAGRVLAAFLAARRLPLKEALLEGDLRRARRLVNGGSHGLDRFVDAWRRGERLLDDPVWVPAREAALVG